VLPTAGPGPGHTAGIDMDGGLGEGHDSGRSRTGLVVKHVRDEGRELNGGDTGAADDDSFFGRSGRGGEAVYTRELRRRDGIDFGLTLSE